MKITYRISELVPYINWVYYYFAWQVKEEAEKQRIAAEKREKSFWNKAIKGIKQFGKSIVEEE